MSDRHGGHDSQDDARAATAPARRGLQARYFVVEPDRAQLGKLAGLIDAGQLRPTVARVFDLGDGAKAFDAKQGGGGLPGRVVLQVAPGPGTGG